MRAGAYSRFGDFVEKGCERHDWIFLFAEVLLLLVLDSREKVIGKFVDTHVAESFTQQNLGGINTNSCARCLLFNGGKKYE